MMGRSCLLLFLLLSVLLLLTFSHGFARNVKETTSTYDISTAQVQVNGGVTREMIEWEDYQEPEPNVNSRSGYLVPPSHPHSPSPSPET